MDESISQSPIYDIEGRARVCSLPVLRRWALLDVETPAVVAGLYRVTPARLRLPAGPLVGQTRRSPSLAALP